MGHGELTHLPTHLPTWAGMCRLLQMFGVRAIIRRTSSEKSCQCISINVSILMKSDKKRMGDDAVQLEGGGWVGEVAGKLGGSVG